MRIDENMSRRWQGPAPWQSNWPRTGTMVSSPQGAGPQSLQEFAKRDWDDRLRRDETEDSDGTNSGMIRFAFPSRTSQSLQKSLSRHCPTPEDHWGFCLEKLTYPSFGMATNPDVERAGGK